MGVCVRVLLSSYILLRLYLHLQLLLVLSELGIRRIRQLTLPNPLWLRVLVMILS